MISYSPCEIPINNAFYLSEQCLEDSYDFSDCSGELYMSELALENILPTSNSILFSRQNSLMSLSRQNSLMSSDLETNDFDSQELYFSSEAFEEQNKPHIRTPTKRKRKCEQNVESVKRQKSSALDVQSTKCFCRGSACTKRYNRVSKHPRILEPSTRLVKQGFLNYHGQIRMPKELQKHVGTGSCKHVYKSLILLLTFVQLNSGFEYKNKNKEPTVDEYRRASFIIRSLSLPTSFFVDKWAPTFQKRFLLACDGKENIQKIMKIFLDM